MSSFPTFQWEFSEACFTQSPSGSPLGLSPNCPPCSLVTFLSAFLLPCLQPSPCFLDKLFCTQSLLQCLLLDKCKLGQHPRLKKSHVVKSEISHMASNIWTLSSPLALSLFPSLLFTSIQPHQPLFRICSKFLPHRTHVHLFLLPECTEVAFVLYVPHSNVTSSWRFSWLSCTFPSWHLLQMT